MTIQPSKKDYETETLEVVQDKLPCVLYIVRNNEWAHVGVTNKPLSHLMASYQHQQPQVELIFSCDCISESIGFGMLFALHGEFTELSIKRGWYPYAPIRTFLDNARQRGASWAIGGIFHEPSASNLEVSNETFTL